MLSRKQRWRPLCIPLGWNFIPRLQSIAQLQMPTAWTRLRTLPPTACQQEPRRWPSSPLQLPVTMKCAAWTNTKTSHPTIHWAWEHCPWLTGAASQDLELTCQKRWRNATKCCQTYHLPPPDVCYYRSTLNEHNLSTALESNIQNTRHLLQLMKGFLPDLFLINFRMEVWLFTSKIPLLRGFPNKL